jgi:hypothetical protein
MPFTITEPTLVCARSFEDEIVVAHFGSGIYYSLIDSAAEVWRGLMASHEVFEVVAALAPRATTADFAKSVQAFVSELQVAGLIKPTAAGAAEPWRPIAPAGGWTNPRAESFSDMRELLLLDPVHDTSEAGWPYVVAG